MKQSHVYIILILCLFLPFVSMAQSSDKPDRKVPSTIEISDQIKNLSKQCWYFRERNTDSALVLGLQALHLAEKHNEYSEIAKVSNYIGVVYMHYMYKYRESIPYFKKAMRTGIIIKDSVQLAYAYNNLGDVYLLSGNIPLALQYGQFSLNIFTALGDEVGMAYGCINMAEVYRAKKDYQKSLDYFEQALSIRKVLDSSTRMGFVLFNRARTLEEIGDLESAMDFYQQSLECSYDTEDFRYVSWSLNGIANIHFKQAQYDSAYVFYSRALEWNQDRNHEYGYINNYIGIALVYAHKKKTDAGEKLLKNALKLASKLEINSQIIKSYNAFFEFYKILGDTEKATESFDIFLMQYDSILAAQQFDIVNELERNFSIQQELIKKEQQHETDESQRNTLITILFLIIAILLILLWLYRTNKKMNRRLEETNQTKDKLFSVISHDLKNPFNTLIGFGDLLKTELEEGNYKEAEKYAAIISKASVEGFNQLNTLLQWSMSQSGKIQFSPELVDLGSLIKDLNELFQINIDKYKVHLEIENTVAQKVFVDPNIIRIILENLITNALKFTQEDGHIKISCRQENNAITIIVKDSGIGISQEIINQLSANKKFIKSQKGLRKETGTGLGLSIVNDLIKIHQGKMNISSQAGIGSSFKLEFPIVQPK